MSWIEVDFDPAVWVEMPSEWTDDTWPDYRDWAWEAAKAVWADSGQAPGEYGIDQLALAFVMLAEREDKALSSLTYLHVPSPTDIPLPVGLKVFERAGEREAALRVMANADDPEAVEPPIVEEFATESLGTGLRTLRYLTLPEQPDTLVGALNYAWRVDEVDTDIRLWTSCPDLSRLIGAIDDIDTLARGIRVGQD
jgi:hypothetical protein